MRAGDLVTCDPRLPSGFLGVEIDGAFAQELVIEENNLYCLSQETSPLHAAFLEPIAACLAPRKHLREDMQKGIIVGAGRIAYLTTRLLHLSGFSSFRQCDTLENIESSSQKVVIATSFNEQMCHDFTRVLERGGLLILKCRPTDKTAARLPVSSPSKSSPSKALLMQIFNEATAFLMKNELKLDDLVGPIFPLNEYKRAFKEARKNISRKVFLTMCGIVGVASLKGPIDKERLFSSLSALRERGPDDLGTWFSTNGNVALGHRRLSIIDLPTGKQPICNEEESVWVVTNGEFYGYESIRNALEKRGHVFRTKSDAEIVVHLYEEYGSKCVDSLRGEFAFILWDGANEELYAFRDRFGIKPLVLLFLSWSIVHRFKGKGIVPLGP